MKERSVEEEIQKESMFFGDMGMASTDFKQSFIDYII